MVWAESAPDVLGDRLGGVYYAERLWLFLPSGDGLPEIHHPLDTSDDV